MKNIALILLINSTFLNYTYQSDLTFHILHTNDLHASYETSRYGGIGRVMQYIAEERAKDPDYTLYLDAGDCFTGSLWFNVHKWKIAAVFTQALSPNASCIGNHEFDCGIDGLSKYIELTKTPLLCSNCDISQEPTLKGYIVPSKILTIHGTNIGIVGYLLKLTQFTAKTVGRVRFGDEIAAVRKEVERLTNANIKVIIVLSHGGIDLDLKIASSVPGVDIVVGGHSHTLLKEYPAVALRHEGGEVIKVPVVQAYAFAQLVGKLTVTFDNNGKLTNYGGALAKMKTVVPHPLLEKILDNFRKELEVYKKTVCGKSNVPFYVQECRTDECNIANLALDSYIHKKSMAYEGSSWSDVGIALINSGSVRYGVQPRDDKTVTLDLLYNAFPYCNSIVTLNISGSVLRQAIEHSVRFDYNNTGKFLQYSGVNVIYDYSKAARQKIESVRVRCADCEIPKYEDLNDEKHYLVLVNDYLAEGRDGFHMFRRKKVYSVLSSESAVNMMCEYMKFYEVVEPYKEGRIIISKLKF